MVDKKSRNKRLIVFDVEGVLLPKRRYLLFEAAKELGVWGFIKIAVIGFLYEIGLLPLETALRKIFLLFKGSMINDLLQLFRKVPLIPGTEEVFEKLNRIGYIIVVISSGLPKLFVEDLATRLKANYAYGLEVETQGGILTGKIGGDVIKHDGKALVLTKLMKEKNLSRQDCIVVADDRNNLPMFPLCALRIGYSPDFMVNIKSDFVIEGDLYEILTPIIGTTFKVPKHIFSKRDLIRETIHLSGFFVPLVCMHLLDWRIVFLLILSVTFIYIVSEIIRLKGFNIPIFSTLTWRAATKPELYQFVTAPIFFALGIMTSLIFFPVPINYASIMILSLGDGGAALFGKILGRNVLPFNKGKRVEGTVFGFLFAFLGALIFVDTTKALVGAAIGILVECLPPPISDNVTVPLSSGVAMMVIP